MSGSRPGNSDPGGHHLAFYVTDMDAAVAHLKRHSVTMLGDPTVMTDGGRFIRAAAVMSVENARTLIRSICSILLAPYSTPAAAR